MCKGPLADWRAKKGARQRALGQEAGGAYLTGPGEGHTGSGCVRTELKGARVDA